MKALVTFVPTFLFLAPITVPGQNSNAQEREYLEQHVIDSMVNRGFYALTEGSAGAGFGLIQEKAIFEARQIAADLRRLAKGDPNEKYIMWKVSELEQQIQLEEYEVRRLTLQKKQKMINHLVDLFNAEVGRRRPDFSTLEAYRMQMHSVDPGKADELAWYMQDRANNIGREVVSIIQNSLNNGNLDNARRELDYCNTNNRYLHIPIPTFGKLSGRLRALVDLDKERAAITLSLKSAKTFLARDSLGRAWSEGTDAKSRLMAIGSSLPRNEWDSYANATKKILAEVERREDALVDKNLLALREKGIDAAIDYHEILKKHGVSRHKTVMVNNAIIESILNSRAVEDTTMSEELTELMEAEGEQSLDMDQMALAAKKLAKHKADSIEAAQQKKPSFFARLFGRGKKNQQDTRVAERREYGTKAEATQFSSGPSGRSSRSETPSSEPGYESTPRGLPVTAKPSQPNTSQQITEQMIQIYTLIEQQEFGEARSRFYQHQEQFRTHLIPEAYAALQASINSVSSPR